MLNFFACRRDPRLAIRQHHSPLSDGCKRPIFCLLPNPQSIALGTAWSVQTASLHSLTRKPQYRHDGACREGRAGRGA